MEYSEKYGKSVEEATQLALVDLKCSIEDVTVIVMEEPSKGFLGLGGKLAKVRVEKKEVVASAPAVSSFSDHESAFAEPAQVGNGEEGSTDPAAPDAPRPSYGKIDLRSKKSQSDETGSSSNANRPRRGGRDRGRGGRDRRDRWDRGAYSDATLTGVNTEVISALPENLAPVVEHAALDFLKATTIKMGLDLAIDAKANEDLMYITLDGEDAGAIIGKRGQTLDAIQYLTSLVVNKDREKYTRVVVDAENYRSKREKTLQQLAVRLGTKVLRSGRSVKLEPMNPYERMVIHATLHQSEEVTTRSEGDEPYRRVIIERK